MVQKYRPRKSSDCVSLNMTLEWDLLYWYKRVKRVCVKGFDILFFFIEKLEMCGRETGREERFCRQ